MLVLTKAEAEAYLQLDGATLEVVRIVENNTSLELPISESQKVVFSVENRATHERKKWFCQFKDLCRYTKLSSDEISPHFDDVETDQTLSLGDWVITRKKY